MQDSLFRKFSLGIAAENLKPGTRQLEVLATESNGHVNGPLLAGEEQLTSTGSDHSGLEYQSVVKTSNTISAIWYPGKSNALTPPTITAGEQVMLYRYADTDQYYWTAEGQSDHLRPTDTVGLQVSAKGAKDETELKESNRYSLEMSSDQKRIRLKTSMANGEKAGYEAVFDLAEGFFEIADHKGTYIQHNSADDEINLEIANGSKAYLSRKNIYLEAPDTIEMKCKVLKVDSKTTEIYAATKASIKSTLVEINGVNTKLSGSSLSFAYTTSAASSGNFTWGGTHNYTTTITHNGVSIGTDHKHSAVRGGTDTSGPVSG